jgi:hypothetical protein
MSFWDTLGWGGSDAGGDAKGTRKGDPSWGSSDAGWGGMGTGKGGPSWGSSDSGKGTGMGTGKGGPTGEYSHGWSSSDAGWDGSCSGKGTRKGGSTGEYSHGWSPYAVAPPPPTVVPPGYGKGFRDGWQKGHNEGLPCGYGKGYARGMDASWEKGVAAFLEERTALRKGAARAGEDDDDEEPEAKKATRKKKQKLYSDWYDAYLARDPPVEDSFPRFQVWNDHGWTDYQEKVNKSLRDSRYARVDLGAIEEVVYQYEVHVVEEGSQDHDEVQGAVRNVKHHKCWQLEFPPQVVGWQSKFEEEGVKKTKTRPVRKLTSPDVSRAVVLLLLLMYYYYNY